jgi:hypothetical protein
MINIESSSEQDKESTHEKNEIIPDTFYHVLDDFTEDKKSSNSKKGLNSPERSIEISLNGEKP